MESRLDNVVFRMGIAPSRRAARQIVSHRHITVNGELVNIPSYHLKAGDKVLKSSKIDLVLGDGKITYEETVDSTAVDSTEIIPLDVQ